MLLRPDRAGCSGTDAGRSPAALRTQARYADGTPSGRPQGHRRCLCARQPRLELVVNCQASAIVTEPHDLTRRVTRRTCTHGHKERLALTLLTCPFFVRITSAAANTRTIASTANVSLKPRISDCRRMIFPRATRA